MKSLNNKLPSPARQFGGLVCLFVVHFTFINAQYHKSFSVEVSLPLIQELSVQSTKPFPSISISDFDKGNITVKNAVYLSLSSNVPWKVLVVVPKENLYISPGKLKRIENIQWRIGSNLFQPFSVGSIVVATGEGGLKNNRIGIDYRLKLGWRDTPPGRWEFDPQFRIEPNY